MTLVAVDAVAQAGAQVGDQSASSAASCRASSPGIGFLGAGVIIHEDNVHRVRGLTTAACVWMTACIGMICGTGGWKILLVAVAFIALLLLVGGPVERALHQRWGK